MTRRAVLLCPLTKAMETDAKNARGLSPQRFAEETKW